MSKGLAVAKEGVNVLTATDPNDFIFHSAYNTFKIVLTGEEEITVNSGASGVDFTVAHGLSFTPLVTAFAKENGQNQAIAPNTENITSAHPVAGFLTTGLKFNSVSSDATSIYFNFSNTGGSSKTVKVRYYCLEEI